MNHWEKLGAQVAAERAQIEAKAADGAAVQAVELAVPGHVAPRSAALLILMRKGGGLALPLSGEEALRLAQQLILVGHAADQRNAEQDRKTAAASGELIKGPS